MSYLKRPLCNQVFRIKPKLEILDFLHRVRNHENKDSQSYLARYNTIFGSRVWRRRDAKEFLRFVLSLGLNSKIIVGVSNIDHLIELSGLETSFTKWSDAQIDDHIEKWNRIASQKGWDPIT